MKKLMITCACLLMAVMLTSADKDDKVMVKENGVYVVNTTTLGKDVIGYEGPTPLKVYIIRMFMSRPSASRTGTAGGLTLPC